MKLENKLQGNVSNNKNLINQFFRGGNLLIDNFLGGGPFPRDKPFLAYIKILFPKVSVISSYTRSYFKKYVKKLFQNLSNYDNIRTQPQLKKPVFQKGLMFYVNTNKKSA